MSEERKLKAIKIGLMRSPPFGLLRGIAMYGNTHLTTEIPTACTDGRDEWYNLDFLFNVIANGDKGVGFVLAHEWMHKAAKHFYTYKGLEKINQQIADIALDVWINDRLVTADPNAVYIEFPVDKDGKRIGIHLPEYHDWAVKAIFYDLLEKAKEGNEGLIGPIGGGGGGLDNHDWEGAKKLSKEEQKQVEGDINEAVRQSMHGTRAGTGGLQDALGLGELVTPKVDWRVALRIFLNATCRKKERSTWRRPNRRFLHEDVIMPTLEGNSINEIVLARDSSGSMYFENRLTEVTSEMVGICDTLDINKIHLLDWDGSVEYRGVFTSDQLKKAPELKAAMGGGGTTPQCVVDYMKKEGIKPDCVVVLTDGEIDDWGNWTVPVLWGIANHKTLTAPMGKTINID